MGNIDVVTIDVLACIKSFIFKPPNSHCGCIIVILVVKHYFYTYLGCYVKLNPETCGFCPPRAMGYGLSQTLWVMVCKSLPNLLDPKWHGTSGVMGSQKHELRGFQLYI